MFQITRKCHLTQEKPNLFHGVLKTFPNVKIETLLTALMYCAHTRARTRELGEGLSGLETSRTSTLEDTMCSLFSRQSPRKGANLKWQHSDRCNPFSNTDTSANVYKCNAKKQRGTQQPEEKNSAFCQQRPQARTHSRALSNLSMRGSILALRCMGVSQSRDTPQGTERCALWTRNPQAPEEPQGNGQGPWGHPQIQCAEGCRPVTDLGSEAGQLGALGGEEHWLFGGSAQEASSTLMLIRQP